MNISKLRNKAEGLVTQLTAKDDCERRVWEAISNKSYAAHITVLNEIAEDTFSHDRYATVMRLVWKTVESSPRNWRAIAKTLILVDHLMKNGAEKVVGDIQMHIHDIRALANFRYLEGGLDRGNGVREKARGLLELLSEPERIREERLKARDLKAQYSGYGSGALTKHSSSTLDLGSSPRDRSDRVPRSVENVVVEDEWRAGYSRSPSPVPLESGRVLGRDSAGSSSSDKIDFDAGREFYTSRISRFQEQERREASLSSGGGSGARRGSKDSAGSQASDRSHDGEGRAQSKGTKGGSTKRTERGPSARAEEKKASGPDLLSGDDPFPTPAPRPPAADFSSFASFAPQVYQGGMSGGGGGVAHQNPSAQAVSQIVPFGFVAPGSQGQQQQQLPQQFASSQAGWGQQGMPGQQQQWGGYGQAMGQGMVEFTPQRQQQPTQMQSYVESGGQRQPYQQGFQQQTYGQLQQQLPQELQLQQAHMYPQYQQQQFQPQQQMQEQQQQQPQHQQQQQYQPYQEQQQQTFSQQVQPQQQYQPQQQEQQQQYQQQPQYQPQQQQQQYQPQQEQQQQLQPQQEQQQQLQPKQEQQQQYQPKQEQQQYQPQQEQPQVQPQRQASQFFSPAETQQSLPSPAQTQASSQLQLQMQPSEQQQQHAMSSGNPQQQGNGTTDRDWVPTEVVRVGIGGQDLAAAVGGLRHTGFKPSDVAGSSTVFMGQGRRGVGSSGPSFQHIPSHPRAPTLPPGTTVEYVEEGQETRADAREFMGARANLNKTGLSGRLRETPQQPPPQQQQQQQRGVSSAKSTTRVTGGGQWEGLVPAGAQQHGGGRPPWQGSQGGGLQSSVIMQGDGVVAGQGVGGVSRQGPGGSGDQGGAPWQQGAGGLRPTGLMGGGGSDPANGLSMSGLNLH